MQGDAGAAPLPFTLREACVGGRGMQPAFRDAGRDRIRDAAYAGRGS